MIEKPGVMSGCAPGELPGLHGVRWSSKFGVKLVLGVIIKKFVSGFVYAAMLLLVYCLAASQAIQSFSCKWTSVADNPYYSLERTLNGSTPRPYAYRLLMPVLIESTVEALSKKTFDYLAIRGRNTLVANLGPVAERMSHKLAVAYSLILVIKFALLVGALVLLRALSRIVLANMRHVGAFVIDVGQCCLP